jgi:hypothetical protein
MTANTMTLPNNAAATIVKGNEDDAWPFQIAVNSTPAVISCAPSTGTQRARRMRARRLPSEYVCSRSSVTLKRRIRPQIMTCPEHIVGISKTRYVLATPRSLDWEA